MIISEAIKQAYGEHKSVMLRRKDGTVINLLPTDTRSKVIASISRGEVIVSWEPTYSELVSDEWEVNYEFRIKRIPKGIEGPIGLPRTQEKVELIGKTETLDGERKRSFQIKNEAYEIR